MKMKILLYVLLLVALSFVYGCSSADQSTSELAIEGAASRISFAESTKSVEATSSASKKEEAATTLAESEPSLLSENTGEIDAVRRYFNAVVAQDKEAFLGAFSEDAVLRVVSREMDTPETLTQFATNEVFGGLYEIYRAEETETGIRMLLQFTPEGWSSPEPMAVYDFTIVDNEIMAADLQYATDQDKLYFRDKTLEKTALMPKGYAAYLAGVDTDNMDLFLSAFTVDGQVLDVRRLIDGPAEIEKWADREVLFLLYSVGRIVYTDKGAEVINHIRFNETSSGFYGSYDMTLVDEMIQYADLQYANSEDYNY